MDIHTEHILQKGHLRLYADISFTAGQLRLIIYHVQKEQWERREGGMARNSTLSACSSAEKQKIRLACKSIAEDSASQSVTKLFDALQLPQQHACRSPKPQCCAELMRVCSMLPEIVRTYKRQLDSALAEIKTVTADRDQKAGTICVLEGLVSELQQDNKRYAEINRDLNVRAEGIRTVTVNEKVSSGKRGRPKGQKPSITSRPVDIDRKETVDCSVCPGCGNDRLSGVTDQYTRVVKRMKVTWENVLYRVNRRYCGSCKKQVSAKVPDAMPNARTSSNHDALLAHLNVNGLSHAKIADTSCDVLKHEISASSSYRSKIRTGKMLEQDHNLIREKIMGEPVLNCDELWWPLGKTKGVVITALGKDACLMEVAKSRDIQTLTDFLPHYDGVIVQDSYAGWMHVGSNRQMCLAHQIRLVKNDLKYKKLSSETEKFLNDLRAILKRLYRADKIKGVKKRLEAADSFDVQLGDLMNLEYKDDGECNIARYQKRYKREKDFMTTFLRQKGVPPDNNSCERANRVVVCVRGDGGGNRTEKGMRANSILFTIKLTDKINMRSFYDHIIRAAAASGDR